MDDLQELYQATILDHHQHPRNFGSLAGSTHMAIGDNPLCGDHIEVGLQIRGGKVTSAKFTGSGCAISRAAGSLMTTIVENKTPIELSTIIAQVNAFIVQKKSLPVALRKVLGPLGGVQAFPARVKCATLAWHTLEKALGKK
jgi:nitrogen fixation NifU-like protein